MVWLRLDNALEGELPVRHRTLRIVHTYEALMEKIHIFDTELDDCFFELLKFMIWPQFSGKNPEQYRGEVDPENWTGGIVKSKPKRERSTCPRNDVSIIPN